MLELTAQIRELGVTGDNFNLVDQWLDAGGRQRHGPVGHGMGRLASARDVVATVTSQLRTNETVFLHEPGVDTQCDEARASIGEDAGRDRRSGAKP